MQTGIGRLWSLTLLNAGYWPTTYWAENYWNPSYWPSGEAVLGGDSYRYYYGLKKQRKNRELFLLIKELLEAHQ